LYWQKVKLETEEAQKVREGVQKEDDKAAEAQAAAKVPGCISLLDGEPWLHSFAGNRGRMRGPAARGDAHA
jgi:hypothetical protein